MSQKEKKEKNNQYFDAHQRVKTLGTLMPSREER
jgi:hypothetical protein